MKMMNRKVNNMDEKKLLNSFYGIPFTNSIYNIILGERSSGRDYQVRIHLCREIIRLYYNGLSERTLNKRYPKELVAKALHSEEFKPIRTYFENEKKQVFLEHWKTHGLSGMVGVKEE